jgi:hypothetical protein
VNSLKIWTLKAVSNYGFKIQTLRAVYEIRTLGTKYGPRLAVSKYTDSGVHQIREENSKKNTDPVLGVGVYTVGTIWSKFVCSGDSRIVTQSGPFLS